MQQQPHAALRRVRLLAGAMAGPRAAIRRALCAASGDTLTIGDVSRKVKRPQNPELVPVKHITGSLSQSTLEHLRWLLQKDVLGQDVFLIGPPGPLRRSIAMQYMELTKREVEYIALSRDTTEGDLKQRREIKGGSAHYLDQCAVRAALLGRVLVLEGVERAERNVLPVLNNLLENREMQLEDGRFLMSAQRYDKLLREHSAEQLAAWRVERVSEEFRVVALGLPVPRYRGNPLDPPLRSRFQARNIPHPPFKEQLEILYAAAPNVPPETLAQLLGFATTMLTPEGATLGLPDFPMNSLLPLARILSIVPGYDAGKLLEQAFPYSALLGPEGHPALQDTLKKFELVGGTGAARPRRIEDVKRSEAVNDSDARSAVITALFGDKRFSFKVMTGMEDLKRPVASSGYHETEAHAGLLADMVLSHTTSDFCLLGGKGCGKSMLARAFADMLGYHMESIMLYQDMTARELLQQRVTLANGDTAWRPSPVVTAARDGSLLLLDGIHRVNPGTLALLHRLVHDRELTLYDGSRLIGADRYEVLQRETGLSSEQLTERGVFPIHPAFRVVALAEPAAAGPSAGPATAGNPQQWLGPEALSMFLYHTVPPLTPAQEMDILRAMVPGLPQDAAHQLLQLAQRLRNARDPTMRSLAASLSTRQLLRMSRRLARYEGEDLHAAIHKACLSRFLPSLARAALQTAMQDAGLETTGKDSEQADIITEVRDGVLHIGDVTAPVSSTAVQTKVPDIIFYDNLQHLRVMEDMLKDFNLGEHLLLVGNQGVGKNKVVDRFLQLLNRPREYLQLHRDTTVQSLTLQPTLRDGVIVYEDSPLVRAVKQGYVLVIDEADKAPVNVTCVLKALVENGEMLLADGRRILAAPGKAADRPGVVSMHTDFRMIVLANRPGFPFLGNDFFSAMGDIFACHAVENPCRSSELAMLQRYGPRVKLSSLEKLAAAFGELRGLADAGLAPYPYSTRELVSVVKHLQMFPDDGLWGAVRSVFDFDAYSPEARDMILSTLHRHGIPAGAHPANVQLAKELPLPPPKLIGHWEVGGQASGDQPWRQCFTEKRTVSVLGPALQPAQTQVAERVDPRGLHFSEEEASWSLKLHETNMACDLAVGSAAPTDMEATTVYVATCNPVGLYALRLGSSGEPLLRHVDLAEVFPRAGVTIWQPLVSVAPLGSHLGGQVLMLEKKSGLVLLLAPEADTVHRLLLWPGEQDPPRPRGQRWWSSKQEQAQEMYCMAKEFSHQNWIVFYKENGNVLDLLHVDKGVVTSIALPINISSLFLVSQDHWLLVESKSNRKFLLVRHGSSATGAEAVYQLKPISEEPISLGFGMLTNRSSTKPVSVSCEELPSENLSAALGERVTCPNRLLADHSTYATLLLGFPELMSPIEVHAWSREEDISSALPHSSCCFLPATNQIVRALPADLVPTSKLYAPETKHPRCAGYLEITDLSSKKVKYIPVPSSDFISPYTSWLSRVSDAGFLFAVAGNERLVTVDTGGHVRLWEIGLASLERSLLEWRNMIGRGEGSPLQVTVQRDSGEDVSDPKHGRTDPRNDPHVGGNTWAGGTGGRDTAGLGGKGGPYRLDAGHTVHQVSQAEKDAVPEDVRRAARAMAEKVFKERLREIGMSEYDAATYERFLGAVRSQVQALRIILDSLEAKGKERQWLRHQTTGELDDAKLIDGLTGERAVYRRRGDQDPELGSPLVKPKRLRVLLDVSGSMYRFNGLDGRLERAMEAACLIMEALQGYEGKVSYDIVGHSGDGFDIELVPTNKVPKNNKQRLAVLKTMHAHSQFCASGDYTVEGARASAATLAQEDADERFLVLFSDANLERYGVPAASLARALTNEPSVHAFVVFIGSLGDQAARLQRMLPAGRSFVAMDTKLIPQILQQIFTTTLLSSL